MSKFEYKQLNYIGIVVTIAATLFFVWGIKEWIDRNNWPHPLSVRQIQANEIKAFKNIKRIIEAQEKYIQQDWNEDGEKTYSPFLFQLWRTVTVHGEYRDIKLLNKNLASAMGESQAYKGYYYHDFRKRAGDDQQDSNLDYYNEWMVAAIPEHNEKTGNLIFLVNQTGDIFVKDVNYCPSVYPNNPLDDGWIVVEAVEELRELQKDSNLLAN